MIDRKKVKAMALSMLACTIVVCVLFIYTIRSWASSEFRSNLSMKYMPITTASTAYGIYIKDEERFQNEKLVYAKQVYGISVKTGDVFSFMPFVAHKHLHYSRQETKKLAGMDINLGAHSSNFFIKDRIRSEYHVTDKFYRFRNATEIGYSMLTEHLSFFGRYEFRFDRDQQRINMNDIAGGIIIKPVKSLSVRLYYNRELKRRNTDSWKKTDALCFGVGAVL